MKTFKLSENHPTMKKMDELNEFMEKLGLSFSITRLGSILVNDNEWPDKVLEIVDLENNTPITSLPSEFEYKIIYQK